MVVGAPGAGAQGTLASCCDVGASCVSEALNCPARRAPRRFLVVRAALTRCGACLSVPAARRGSFGLGAASDGAASDGQGCTSRRVLAGSALASAACALLRWVSCTCSEESGLGAAYAGAFALLAMPCWCLLRLLHDVG